MNKQFKVGDLVQELSTVVSKPKLALVIRCLHSSERDPHHTYWLVQFLDGTRDTLRESFLEPINASR